MKTEATTPLTKLQKRVLIARDVKRQLKTGKTAAVRGTYFRIKGTSDFSLEPFALDPSSQGVQKTLQTKECYGCAKGALLIAYVRRFNSMDLDDLRSENMHMQGQEAYRGTLVDLFGARMLNLMEIRFEDGRTKDGRVISPTRQLTEMMNRLIKTGGRSI